MATARGYGYLKYIKHVMKFVIPFSKKTHIPKQRREGIDARRYWVWLLVSFTIVLTVELAYLSFVFWKTSKEIDAPATASFETNAHKIEAMQKTLDNIDAAIAKRTGGSPLSSPDAH